MPAKSKEELRSAMEKEYSRLAHLIDGISEEVAMRRWDDDTSIKDVVAHRAHWIDLFLGWHADGLAGKEVHFPAEGYKWSDLKRYNADLRADQADIDWPAAVALLAEKHRALSSFVEFHAEIDLYGMPMKGAKNGWTTGRWAEAAGPSHYRSAAKFIRSRLKALR